MSQPQASWIRVHHLGHWCILIYLMQKDVHTRTQTGSHYINSPYSAQDRSGPSEQKKNKRKRRWGGLWVWFCEAVAIRTENEREKPGLLNLKQYWGHEDGLLFIATDFLFKRALLLCFLSRLCYLSLTFSLFLLYSCTLCSTNKGEKHWHMQV